MIRNRPLVSARSNSCVNDVALPLCAVDEPARNVWAVICPVSVATTVGGACPTAWSSRRSTEATL